MILYLAGAGLKENEIIENLPENEDYNRLISYFYKSQVTQLIKVKESKNESKPNTSVNRPKLNSGRLVK